MLFRVIFLLLGFLGFSLGTLAEQPVVGRKAAQKYFQEGKAEAKEALSPKVENLLMLHYGVFTNSTSYSWGWPQANNPGQNSYGLTYLLEEWNGMDLNLRADYVTYSIFGTNAQKISLMPLLIFSLCSSSSSRFLFANT